MQHEIDTAVIELPLLLSEGQDSPVLALDDAQLHQVVGGLPAIGGDNTPILLGPNTGW